MMKLSAKKGGKLFAVPVFAPTVKAPLPLKEAVPDGFNEAVDMLLMPPRATVDVGVPAT